MNHINAMTLALMLGLSIPMSTLWVSSAYAHEDIELPMKKMRTAMKAAMSSESLPELTQQVQQLKHWAAQAAKQHYHGNPDEQATYQQGLERLQKGLLEVEAAIAKQDLQGAKQILESLNDIKKQYHKKLDV